MVKPLKYILALLFFLLLESCGEGLGCLGTQQSCPSATAVSISAISSQPNADGTVTISISGSGFVSGATVSIDKANCYNVVVLSSAKLTCILPSGNIPLVGIVITEPGGGSSGGGSGSGGLQSPLISAISANVSNIAAGGSGSWTNISNAMTSDGTYTSSANLQNADTNGTPSDYLYFTGFFPSSTYPLSSTAKIEGVIVNCYWRTQNGSNSDASESTWAQNVFLLINGTKTGTNHGNNATIIIPSGFTLSANIGTSTDLWGATLTASDITNSNFGVAFQMSGNSNLSTSKVTQIDYCEMAVYWH